LAARRRGGKVANPEGSRSVATDIVSWGGKMSAALAMALLLQAAPPPQRPPPSTSDMPGWSKSPGPEDMTRAYPQEAGRVNLAGSATLECTVGAEGELQDCVASGETPAGAGFGEASLAVASKFRMPTKSPSGAQTAGRTVRFPIQWMKPAKGQAPPVVVYDDAGRSGSVGFNCRVRDERGLDNCVVVDAKPRGTTLFTVAGEAIQRTKAPSSAQAGSRLMVVVEVKPQSR
jgi:TonB family protein